MSQNDFTIKELKFDIDIEENNDFDKVALDLTKLANDFLAPRLDDLSYSFVDGKEDVVVHKIVVDLGEIVLQDKREITEAIIDKLKKEIQSFSLLHAVKFRTVEGLILHFVRHGSLPWWANNKTKFNQFLSRNDYEEDSKKSIYDGVTKNKFYFQRFFNALNSKNKARFFKEYLQNNYLFFSNGILFLEKLLAAILGKIRSKDSARIHYELFTSLLIYHNKLDIGFSLVLKKVIEDFTIEWNTVQEVLALKSKGLKSFSEHLEFDENRFFSNQLSFKSSLSSLAQIRMFIEHGIINELKNFGLPYLISEFTHLLNVDKKSLHVLFLQLNVDDEPVKLYRVSKLVNLGNLHEYLKIYFEVSRSVFLRHTYSFVKFMELKGEINSPSVFSFLHVMMKLKTLSSSTNKDFYKTLIGFISNSYGLSDTFLFVEFYFFSTSQEYQTDFQEVIELLYANEIKQDAKTSETLFIQRFEKEANFSYATLLSSSQIDHYNVLIDQIGFLNQSVGTGSWTKSYIKKFVFEALIRNELRNQNPLVYVVKAYAKATNLDVHKLIIALLMEFYATEVFIENQNMIVLEYVLLVIQAKSFEIFSKTEQVFIQKMINNKILKNTYDLLNVTHNFKLDATRTSGTQKHYYQLLVAQITFLNESVVLNSWTQSFTEAFIANLMIEQSVRSQYSLLDVLKIYAETNRFSLHRLVVRVLMKFYSTAALLEKGGIEIFEYVRLILKSQLDFNFNSTEQQFIETIKNNETIKNKLGLGLGTQNALFDVTLLSATQKNYYELLIAQVNFLNQFVVFNSWTKSRTNAFVYELLMSQNDSKRKGLLHVLEVYADTNRSEIHQLVVAVLMKFYPTPLLLEKGGDEILEYVRFILNPQLYASFDKKEQQFIQKIMNSETKGGVTQNIFFDVSLLSATQKKYYELLIAQVNFLNQFVVFNSWTKSRTSAFVYELLMRQNDLKRKGLLHVLEVYADTNRLEIHQLVVAVLMKFYPTPLLLEKGGDEILEYVRFILNPQLYASFDKKEQQFIQKIMNSETKGGVTQNIFFDVSLLSATQKKYYELLMDQINFLNQSVVFNSWTKSDTQTFVFNSLGSLKSVNRKTLLGVLEIYAQTNRFEIYRLVLGVLMKFYSTPELLEKGDPAILEYVLYMLKPDVYPNINKSEQGFIQSLAGNKALLSAPEVASLNYKSELDYFDLQEFKSQDTFFKENLYYLFEELNALIDTTTVLKLNKTLLLQILIIELKKYASKKNQFNYQTIIENIADLANSDMKKLSFLLLKRIGSKTVYNAKDVQLLHQINDDLFSYSNLKNSSSEGVNEIVNLVQGISDRDIKRTILIKYIMSSPMAVLKLKEQNYKELMHSLVLNEAHKYHIILTNILTVIPYQKRSQFEIRLKQTALFFAKEKNMSNEQFYQRLLNEINRIDTVVYHQIKTKLTFEVDSLLLEPSADLLNDESEGIHPKNRQQDVDAAAAAIQRRYDYELQNYKPIHSLNERDFDYFLSLKNELTKDNPSQLFNVKPFKNIDDILVSDASLTDFLILYLDDFELLLEFARASFIDPIKSGLEPLLKNELSQIGKLEKELIKLHDNSFFTTLNRLEYKIFLRLFVLKGFAHYKLNARFDGAEFTFNFIENLSVNRKINFKQTSSISTYIAPDTKVRKQIKEGIVSFFDRNNFEFIQNNVKEVEFQKNTIYFSILNDQKYNSDKDQAFSAAEKVKFIEARIKKMDAPYIRELLQDKKTASFFTSTFKNMAFDVQIEVFKLLETSNNSTFSITSFYRNITKLKDASDAHIRLIFEQIISDNLWDKPSILYVFDEIYTSLKKKTPKHFKFIVALKTYYPSLKVLVGPTKLVSNTDKLELVRYYIQRGKLPRAIEHKREIHLQLLKAFVNKEQLKLLIMEFSGTSMRSKNFIQITSKDLFMEVILEELEEIDADFKIIFNVALQWNIAQFNAKRDVLLDLLLNNIIATRSVQKNTLKQVFSHFKSLTPKIYQSILKITYKLITNSSNLKTDIPLITYLNFEAFSTRSSSAIAVDLPLDKNAVLNSLMLKRNSPLLSYVRSEATLYASVSNAEKAMPEKNDEQVFHAFLNQLRYFIEFKSFNRAFEIYDESALYLNFWKFKSKLILKKQLYSWSKHPSKLAVLFKLFPAKELTKIIAFAHPKQMASITTFNEVLKVFGYHSIEAYLHINSPEKLTGKVLNLWSKQRIIINSPHRIVYSLFEELLLHKDIEAGVLIEQLQKGLERLNSAQVLLVKFILMQSAISKVTAKSEQSIIPEKNKVIYESEESIYINNAGLILVWPFLSTLFNKLDLLEGNAFIDDYSLQKAILLTQYVIFEGDETEETNLVLNKLLCGVSPDFFVDVEIELSDTEKSITKTLLNAVTGNWEQLSKTSIPTFKETFLKREGIIQKVDDNYKLIVEKKPFDMLLRTIPWNISMIQNSFMSFRLFVEWEN